MGQLLRDIRATCVKPYQRALVEKLFIIMASLSTELRRAVRTSTWKKDTRGHVHDFPKEGEGGEVHNEETDFFLF